MAIVQLDKVLSGVSGNLESVIAYSDATKQLENYPNGVFVEIGQYVEKADAKAKITRVGEVRQGILSTKGTGDVVMLHAPELQYDEKKFMRDFRNEAGKVVRGYRLSQGDILTFTDSALPITNHTDLAVGDKLVVEAGRLVKLAGEAEAGQLVFEVSADAGNELDIVETAWVIQVK